MALVKAPEVQGLVPASAEELTDFATHAVGAAVTARNIANRLGLIGQGWLKERGEKPWTPGLESAIHGLMAGIQELDVAASDLEDQLDATVPDAGLHLKALQDVLVRAAALLDTAKRFEEVAKAARPGPDGSGIRGMDRGGQVR